MKRMPRHESNESLPLDRRTLLTGVAATAAAIGFGHVSFLGASARAQDATPASDEPAVIVGDVVDFELDANGRWPGHFGSVTLKLHPAHVDGADAWYIRTDGQHTVLSTVPARDDFTPAFRVHNVAFTGAPELLDSVEAISAAEQAGTIAIEATDIVVNYPLVLWPDGGLPVDPDLANPLGPGILVAPPDTAAGTVTFKLHQCYPGSRYIATDTSAVPMAGMMGVVGSAPTQLLIEAKATAPIYVFGNGIPGPAAMGFQPSIFNSKAGDGIWSPFWEHFTVVWNDPAAAVLLTSEAEVKEHQEAGAVTIYAGVPETDPVSFVVNCPRPFSRSIPLIPQPTYRLQLPFRRDRERLNVSMSGGRSK